jgi:hypothetical protein
MSANMDNYESPFRWPAIVCWCVEQVRWQLRLAFVASVLLMAITR